MDATVNVDQFEQMMAALTEQANANLRLLAEIRDRLPAPTVTSVTGAGRFFQWPAYKNPEEAAVAASYDLLRKDPAAMAARPASTPVDVALSTAKRDALWAVLRALNGWIEGSFENHWANEHRGEPVGSECWTRFHPQDFRKMVNDAAREVGIDEIGIPVEPLEETIGR
jgi:hypothetical protein